jgi:hypothetical protein
MARSKDAPKPLTALKHDFYASVDNVIAQAIMVIQANEFALKHDLVKEPAKTEMAKVTAAFRAAVFTDE